MVVKGTLLPPETVPAVPTVPDNVIMGAPAAVDAEFATSMVVPKAAM
jgi:hypothetical protein